MITKLGILTLAIGALAGCATTPPPPTVAMTRAETSVEQADQAGARRYDPGTLDTSKEKMAASRNEAQKGNKLAANQLAEQAELDAELAAATARSASAKKAADEVKASTETLRAEIARQAAR
jgi:Domain of unknown function (DUF4398)